jgi:uncharacterized membrane protein YeaQ/YmgE (transglycosylase-associated protein family)
MLGITDYAVAGSCAIAASYHPQCVNPVLGIVGSHIGFKLINSFESTSRFIPIVRFVSSIIGSACCHEVLKIVGSRSVTSWLLFIPSSVFWAHKWGLILSLFVVPTIEYLHRRMSDGLVRHSTVIIATLENVAARIDSRPTIAPYENEATLDESAPLRCKAQPAPPGSVQAQDNFCAVCQETFAETMLHRVLPCGHAFHASCVDPWILNRSATCPMCRYNLLNDQQETLE